MYLPAFTTPTSKVRVTAVTIDRPMKPMDDRVGLVAYNPSKTESVEIGLTEDIASFKLMPGESRDIGSPVWHGPIFLVTGKTITLTEVLRFDAT